MSGLEAKRFQDFPNFSNSKKPDPEASPAQIFSPRPLDRASWYRKNGNLEKRESLDWTALWICLLGGENIKNRNRTSNTKYGLEANAVYTFLCVFLSNSSNSRKPDPESNPTQIFSLWFGFPGTQTNVLKSEREWTNIVCGIGVPMYPSSKSPTIEEKRLWLGGQTFSVRFFPFSGIPRNQIQRPIQPRSSVIGLQIEIPGIGKIRGTGKHRQIGRTPQTMSWLGGWICLPGIPKK